MKPNCCKRREQPQHGALVLLRAGSPARRATRWRRLPGTPSAAAAHGRRRRRRRTARPARCWERRWGSWTDLRGMADRRLDGAGRLVYSGKQNVVLLVETVKPETLHARAASAAARRHPRRRVHPHGDGPDLRDDPRRPRRRGHQGRAARPATTRAGCSARAPASSRCSTATRRASRSTLKDPRGREIVAASSSPAPTSSARTSRAARWPGWASTTPSLSALNPRLIYVSHKGFLPGPYEHRTALDEVVQMMGGLAYMTGPGPAAARRQQRQRHHGRHVRRHRRAGRAEPARAAPAAARRCRARCSRTTCSSSRST